MILPLPCGRVALLDDADAILIAGYRWYAALQESGKHYARGERHRGDPRVYMHRLIMGETDPAVLIDHRNGEGLHNWRVNLRPGTIALNNRNVGKRSRKKPFKGVYRGGNLFYAVLAAGGQTYRDLGHATAEDAARAYDRLARLHHGEWARLNFPGDAA